MNLSLIKATENNQQPKATEWDLDMISISERIPKTNIISINTDNIEPILYLLIIMNDIQNA